MINIAYAKIAAKAAQAAAIQAALSARAAAKAATRMGARNAAYFAKRSAESVEAANNAKRSALIMSFGDD